MFKKDLEEFFDKFTGKGRAKREILQNHLPYWFCETVIMTLLWGDKYPVLWQHLYNFGEYLSSILRKHNPRNLKKEELIYWIVRTPIDDDEQLVRKTDHLVDYLSDHYFYNLEKPQKYDKEKFIQKFNSFIDEYFIHFCEDKTFPCVCCNFKYWRKKYCVSE